MNDWIDQHIEKWNGVLSYEVHHVENGVKIHDKGISAGKQPPWLGNRRYSIR